jgi:uncharacterized protein (TIGR02145 family)
MEKYQSFLLSTQNNLRRANIQDCSNRNPNSVNGGSWQNSNGTDEFGFSALPGSYGSSGGSFSPAGTYGFWWSATELPKSSYAYSWRMDYDGDFESLSAYVKSYLYSVRCLQD